MKFHEFDNRRHYRRMRERGLTSRDEPYGGPPFEERLRDNEIVALIEPLAPAEGSHVLVIGTGTGADACALAERGLVVTGVDIVPDAIDVARRLAGERDLDIRYVRDDICSPREEYGLYDVIADSYCLQSVVSDAERAAVFRFVREHLSPCGNYVVVCAGFGPHKRYGDDEFRDPATGIVLRRAKPDELALADLVDVGGVPHVPVRRHHTSASFRRELRDAGFADITVTSDPAWDSLRARCSPSA